VGGKNWSAFSIASRESRSTPTNHCPGSFPSDGQPQTMAIPSSGENASHMEEVTGHPLPLGSFSSPLIGPTANPWLVACLAGSQTLGDGVGCGGTPGSAVLANAACGVSPTESTPGCGEQPAPHSWAPDFSGSNVVTGSSIVCKSIVVMLRLLLR